ncbi:MAG TPA: POTRA domain-containing protein [Candidatus Edwardsbacteria bacterium]|nr:POTRA domain-containing protein [Candidatus Edwardsbacteria bacterium]
MLTVLLAAAAQAGPALTVAEVRGSVFFSRGQVRRMLEESTDTAASLQRLAAAYRGAGFLDAALRASWNSDSTAVAIDISEGPRYRAGAPVLRGNDFIAASYLTGVLQLKPGSWFDQQLLRQDLAAISLAYADAGFPHAAVSLSGIALSGDTVGYGYQISEGPRVVVSSVRFDGNAVTTAATAARLSGLRTEQQFSRLKLEQARSRLLRSGLFAEARVSGLFATDVPGREELRLAVVENKYNTFFGALGYNQGDQRPGWLTGTVELEMRNIAGTARRMAFRWERLRQYNSSLAASYQEPWLLGSALGAAVDLRHTIQDSLYTQSAAQALLTLPLGDRSTVGAGGSLERTVPGTVPGVRRSLLYGSLWTAAGDHRDYLRLMAGWRYGLRLQYGRKRYYDPDEQLTVGRAEADLEWTVKAAAQQMIDIAAHARLLATSEHPAPRADQYYLGGAATLRGYFEQQFAASQLAWAAAEYRWSPAPGFECYPFCDAGYLRDRDRGPDRIKAGYGAGFRLQTRIGRFQFDYGLGQGDRPLDGKVHLIMRSDF